MDEATPLDRAPEPAPPAAPPRGLSLRARLGLRAAYLLGAVVALAVGLRVDPTPLVTKGGACDDALRRRRHVADEVRRGVLPADIATKLDQFKGEYAFGAYAMSAYALVNVALDAPGTKAETLELLDVIVERLSSPAISSFDAVLWSEEPLATLSKDRGHIAYLGHLNLVLGARRLLGGDARHDALHGEITGAIARRMRALPHRHVETYPGETYTMDNVVAVASLAVADRVRGEDHRALIDEWLAYTRAELLDPTTGLIVFQLESQSGAPQQRGRGSAAGWASFFLPMIDLPFARAQWEAARTHLHGRVGPFAGVREYHPDDPSAGFGDIDSGPVLVWGVSATGFSIAGAKRHGDVATLGGLLSLAEAFGISVDDETPLGPSRRYVAAPLLGQSILLCMSTARPWWDGMGERR